jgi:hypothetical protein
MKFEATKLLIGTTHSRTVIITPVWPVQAELQEHADRREPRKCLCAGLARSLLLSALPLPLTPGETKHLSISQNHSNSNWSCVCHTQAPSVRVKHARI